MGASKVTPWRVLVVFATIDVTLRAAAYALASLITGAASAGSGWLAEAAVVAQFAFVIASVYAANQYVLWDKIGHWIDRRVARWILTATSLTSYAVITLPLPTVITLLSVILGAVALVGVMHVESTDPFLNRTDGLTYRMLSKWVDEDDSLFDPDSTMTVHPEATGLGPTLSRLLFGGCIVMVMTTAAAYIGLAVSIFGMFWPALEVIVLAGAVVEWRRAGRDDSRTATVDFEDRFYEPFEWILTHPPKGFLGLIFVFAGLLAASAPFVGGITVVAALSTSETSSLLIRPVEGFTVGVVVVACLVAGCYGLWYWYGTVARLTQFLDSLDNEGLEDRFGRPLWVALPPLVLVSAGTAIAMAGAVYMHHRPELTAWPPWLVFTLLSVLIIGIVSVVVVGLRARRAAGFDHGYRFGRTAPATAGAYLLVTVFCVESIRAYGAIEARGLGEMVSVFRTVLGYAAIAVPTVLFFYFEDFIEWWKTTRSRYALILAGAYFATNGLLLWVGITELGYGVLPLAGTALLTGVGFVYAVTLGT